jgi:transposase InsO family protein
VGRLEHCEIRSTSSPRLLKPLGKDQILGAVGVRLSSSHLERHGIQRTAPSSIVPWLSNLAGYEFQNTDFIGDQRYRLKHIRGAPYHPMTQGKIERYHRSMKNVVKLQTFYFPWELEQTIEGFVTYYNNARYHESWDNLTPADVYFGRAKEVKTRREQIKHVTSEKRRQWHR